MILGLDENLEVKMIHLEFLSAMDSVPVRTLPGEGVPIMGEGVIWWEGAEGEVSDGNAAPESGY